MSNELNLPHFLRSRLTMVGTLAAMKGGEILRRKFGMPMKVNTKTGRYDLVTEWDSHVEQVIIAFIKEHFPEHAFVAEESGESGKKGEIQWVIDPIDGTVNFAHAIPIFAISIATLVQSEVVSGVIYNPMTNEFFIAEKGNGAYLNGGRLRVTETSLLYNAIVATGFPSNVRENPRHCLDHFNTFDKMGIPLRCLGSAALELAYIAAGRLDCFWTVSLRPWDYMAAKLLIEESGGSFSDFEGRPYTSIKEGAIVASNGVLHDQMLKNIQAAFGERERLDEGN